MQLNHLNHLVEDNVEDNNTIVASTMLVLVNRPQVHLAVGPR